MWLLTNETPFAAERSWIRDEHGAEFWLVAIRASFEIDDDGFQQVAESQTDVKYVPEFAGDPMETGMLWDGDFILSKAGTDVLVEGSAVTKGRRPMTESGVRFAVGDIDKSLLITGDRRMYEGAVGPAMTAPAPFTDMPITWERAYGGWDKQCDPQAWEPANPVGLGFAGHPAHLFETQAPNISYPEVPYAGFNNGKPAGIGPVAHHWQPRVKYAGTYGKAWKETRDPLLPVDFDRRYWRSAPVDQQTAKPLQGYEEVRIAGMTEDWFLGFRLPRIVFDVVTQFRGAADVRQAPEIQTLWLKPNDRRFEIVWLSALEVPPGREEKLFNTTVRIRPRQGTPDSVRQSGVWVSA